MPADDWSIASLRENAESFAKTHNMTITEVDERMHKDVRVLLQDLHTFLTTNPNLRQMETEEISQLTARLKLELSVPAGMRLSDPGVKHR